MKADTSGADSGQHCGSLSAAGLVLSLEISKLPVRSFVRLLLLL